MMMSTHLGLNFWVTAAWLIWKASAWVILGSLDMAAMIVRAVGVEGIVEDRRDRSSNLEIEVFLTKAMWSLQVLGSLSTPAQTQADQRHRAEWHSQCLTCMCIVCNCHLLYCTVLCRHRWQGTTTAIHHRRACQTRLWAPREEDHQPPSTHFSVNFSPLVKLMHTVDLPFKFLSGFDWFQSWTTHCVCMDVSY